MMNFFAPGLEFLDRGTGRSDPVLARSLVRLLASKDRVLLLFAGLHVLDQLYNRQLPCFHQVHLFISFLLAV